MGNLHLVTGHAGKAHVTAADHGSLNAALFGEGEYVLDRGNQFANTIISNNQIRIADGDLLMQGRHIRLNEGSYVDLTVENGAQGMKRYDLVVARYTKDSLSGVEDCNLVVIKGTANASTATDPEYNVGSIIHDNVLLADMPIYRIVINNLTLTKLVPLFTVLPTVEGQYNTLAEKVDDKITEMEGSVDKFTSSTVTLAAGGWVNNLQTVTVPGVTADITKTDVLASGAPDDENWEAYTESGIRAYAQGNGTVQFKCTDVPSVDVKVNVTVRFVDASTGSGGTVSYPDGDEVAYG